MEQPAVRDRDSRYVIVCWRKHAVLWVADHRNQQTNKQENNRRTDIHQNTLFGRQAHATGPTNGLRAQIVPFRPATDAASTAGVLKLATLAVLLHDSDLRRRDAVLFAKFRWVAVPSSPGYSSPILECLHLQGTAVPLLSVFISKVQQSQPWTPTYRTPRRHIPKDWNLKQHPSDQLQSW